MPVAQADSCVTIRDVFEIERELSAPLYQRRYSWDKKNLTEFWEDVAHVEDGTSEALFLGAIILKHDAQSDPSRGTLERFLILDGQQRIATLYLALLAVALEWQDHEHHETAAAIAETYLMSTRTRTKGKSRFLPTLPDLPEFKALCRQLKVDWEWTYPDKHRPGKMTAALHTARSEIQSRCLGEDGLSGESLRALEQTLVDKAELAVINIAERHQPNEVFDRLNRKGQILTVGDLVKNEIFRRLNADVGTATQLYHDHWEPFERSFAEKKLLDNYYYPYTLTVDDNATVAGAFKVLSKHWDAMIKEDSDAATAAELIIEDLQQFVEEYNALSAGVDYECGPIVKQWIARLVRIPVPRVTYAFLIQLLRAHRTDALGPEDTAECLKTIESFLVRRSFSGLEPTGLHAVFKGLWQKNGGNPKSLVENLQTRTIQFPDDDQFRRDICSKPFYGRKLDGYVLAELEIATHRTNPLSPEQLRDITVDHIAPRSLKGEWGAKFPMTSDEQARVLDLLGNLVPLSQSDNSTKGTLGWSEASTLLRNETIYRTSRDVLDKFDDWGPEQIRQRTTALAEECVRREFIGLGATPSV
jgi:hypothetical protein